LPTAGSAESAICRAVTVDEYITLLISADLATASRLLREPWASLWQASVTTVVGRTVGDDNVLLLMQLAALLLATPPIPYLSPATPPGHGFKTQPGPADTRRAPRGRRIGQRAIAPLKGGQPT